MFLHNIYTWMLSKIIISSNTHSLLVSKKKVINFNNKKMIQVQHQQKLTHISWSLVHCNLTPIWISGQWPRFRAYFLLWLLISKSHIAINTSASWGGGVILHWKVEWRVWITMNLKPDSMAYAKYKWWNKSSYYYI